MTSSSAIIKSQSAYCISTPHFPGPTEVFRANRRPVFPSIKSLISIFKTGFSPKTQMITPLEIIDKSFVSSQVLKLS